MTTPAAIAYRNYLATTPTGYNNLGYPYRSGYAAGYAMWDAAVEACAKVAQRIGDKKSVTYAFDAAIEIRDAIRSLMTPKGPTEQEVVPLATDSSSRRFLRTSDAQPQPAVANDKARVAMALAEFQKSDCFTNKLTGMADEHHLRIWFEQMARIAIASYNQPKTPTAPPPGEGEIESKRILRSFAIRFARAKTSCDENRHIEEALRRLTQPQNAAAGEGGK